MLGMPVRGPGAWFWIREGDQSWEFTIEGRGSKVGLGGRHAFEAAGSLVSNPRGGSEFGIHHRG